VLHDMHPEDENMPLAIHGTFVKVKAMSETYVFNILLHRIMLELQYKELRREFYDFNMVQVLKKHK